MYTINYKNTNGKNCLELSNSDTNFFANICLKSGASLQKLILKDKEIIKEFENNYTEKPFASAILFPFTGRVKNGMYNFEYEPYKLEENKNALHGFIYNKEFNLVNYEVSKEMAIFTLKYSESKKNKGFPYNYSLLLTYTFTHKSVILDVVIENKDINSFPFSVGWHPYFFSSDLSNSYISIESDKKIVFDNEMIPIKIKNNKLNSQFKIKNKKLDDCFILKNNTIDFKTPNYNLTINSSSQENYLQVYTPPDRNDCIAIEPMTAPVDSLNSKVGLRYLTPGETYNITWEISITENKK